MPGDRIRNPEDRESPPVEALPAALVAAARLDEIEGSGLSNLTNSHAVGQWHYHYRQSGSLMQTGGLFSGDLSGWHTYTVHWTRADITWYVDGVQVERVAGLPIVSIPMIAVFDYNNAAEGGQFVAGGELLIDYLRVWH